MRFASCCYKTIFEKKHSVLFVFLVAFFVRLLLVSYGLWQDTNFAVKYTDIDYEVMNGGARYALLAKSPYEYNTFRYTPLLAYLHIPNVWLCKLFGKFLFLSCDLAVGYTLFKILQHLFNEYHSNLGGANKKSSALFYSCIWLFNPVIINVSTRGNAESINAILSVLALYLVFVRKNFLLGGIIYGLSVHLRIYPIIYCLAYLFYIDSGSSISNFSYKENWIKLFVSRFFSKNKLIFTFSAILTFTAITAVFYRIYGWPFLYEVYLYHLTRKDHRHNLSVYFYDFYLSIPENSLVNGFNNPSSDTLLTLNGLIGHLRSNLINAVFEFSTQLASLLILSIKFYQDITFCLLLLSLVFVTFNKVCTIQYYCWYIQWLPLALPWTRLKLKAGLVIFMWEIFVHALWFYFAYSLEFLGKQVFLPLWISGLIYFLSNVSVIASLIHFQNPKSLKLKNKDF
ncbi:GPI mannosyltransferase 1-like [Schistocerca gregaria]|uniref:GPI mannosyltransferase 1-like n=1 Tax=Schistocerca gregaria TaxID=7010 RepID=UPI00211F364B|nr:GPI mannosyltransferase 1-like [Schistocerca gregaria]